MTTLMYFLLIFCIKLHSFVLLIPFEKQPFIYYNCAFKGFDLSEEN